MADILRKSKLMTESSNSSNLTMYIWAFTNKEAPLSSKSQSQKEASMLTHPFIYSTVLGLANHSHSHANSFIQSRSTKHMPGRQTGCAYADWLTNWYQISHWFSKNRTPVMREDCPGNGDGIMNNTESLLWRNMCASRGRRAEMNKCVIRMSRSEVLWTQSSIRWQRRGRAVTQRVLPGTASLMREQRPEGKAGGSLEQTRGRGALGRLRHAANVQWVREEQRRPGDPFEKDSKVHWWMSQSFHHGPRLLPNLNILQNADSKLSCSHIHSNLSCSQVSTEWISGEGKEKDPIRQWTWLLKLSLSLSDNYVAFISVLPLFAET